MLDVASLGFRVDARQLTTGTSELNRFASASNNASAVVGRLGSALSILGVSLSAAAFVKAANSYDAMANSLRVLGLEGQQVTDRLAEIGDVAARTRTPIESMAQLYQRTSIAAKELGVSQEQIMGFTESVGTALAVQGTSAQEASGALQQLTQALAGGVVRAEEFNSIMEGAPTLVMAAANGIDEAGGSVGRLRNLMLEGQITSREFFDAILSQSGALQAQLANTDITMGQAFTTLNTGFTQLVGVVNNALGATSSFAAMVDSVGVGMTTLSKYLAENGEVIQRVTAYVLAAGVAYGTVLAASMVRTLVPAITATIQQMFALEMALGATGKASAAMSVAIKLSTGALRLLRGAIIATGFGAIIVAMGEAINLFMRLKDATGTWGGALKALGELAKLVWQGIIASGQAIPAGLSGVWLAVKADFLSLVSNLSQLWIGFLDTILADVGKMNLIPGQFGLLFKYEIENPLAEPLRQAQASATEFQANTTAMAAETAEGMRRSFGNAGTMIRDAFAPVGEKFQELTAATDEASQAADGVGAAAEAAGVAAAGAGAKAAAGAKDATAATQDLLKELHREIDAREALIGVSGEERTRMEALQQVYSKLGDTAGQYSEAAIQGAADRIVAVDRETAKWEEHMGRVEGLVDDLASSWGDWLAGGLKDFGDFAQSILDSFKNMISSMIATAAKNRIMISMGMSGVPGMSAAGVPGMGGLGSIGGSIAGFGSSIAAGFGSVLSGFGAGGISGGFGAITAGLSGATSGLAGLGVALGAVALPIAALAAVFSFFKKSTKELDAGLRITVDGMDAMVETFSKTETRRFWGLSKKRKTSYDDASDEVSDPIENYVAEMQSAVLEAAASLGVGASAFEDFAAQISFSTKGLSEEQAIAKIQEEMGKIGDKFAELVPGMAQFALEGEGALATLNRLTTNLSVVNGTLADLGLNLYQASVAGAGAATAFADLFGGLEAFQQASSAYYQAFYTDGERLARLQEISTKAVRDAGLAVPATREAYRQLIEAQDLSTEAGREAAALLIQMAPAFDQLYTAADAARASVLDLANAQRQLITDSGDLRRQMIRDSLTEEQRAAQDLARMNRVFEDMGVTVPQTAAEYRELLRGLDLTTEAGREALASLNGVGEILLDTFADALSAAEAAQQSVADARASREALLNDLMTEEQRAAQSQAQIMAVFESLNMAVPQTIEGLQALVQGLDLTTEAGRIALAAISEIAADLRDQLAASRQPTEARQREERIDAGRTAYASRVASQTKDLEKQIADLTMSDAQKRQQEIREREHLLRTMTPLNASLQQMVWRLEDAKQAVDELDTDKFSTLVDYERARARSANVNNAPGGTPAAEKKATEDRQKNDSLVLAEMRDYLLAVTNNTHRAARETRDLRVLQEIQTVQTGTAG